MTHPAAPLLFDGQVAELLLATPKSVWLALWAAAPAFDPDAGHFTRVFLSNPVDSWVTLDDLAETAVMLLHATNVVFPFDWIDWYEPDTYPGGAGLDAAPVAEAARLTTALVRADKFSTGLFHAAVEDGTMAAVMSRLRTWFETEFLPAYPHG